MCTDPWVWTRNFRPKVFGRVGGFWNRNHKVPFYWEKNLSFPKHTYKWPTVLQKPFQVIIKIYDHQLSHQKCVSPADVGTDENYFTLTPATPGGFVIDEPRLDSGEGHLREKFKINFLNVLYWYFVDFVDEFERYQLIKFKIFICFVPFFT